MVLNLGLTPARNLKVVAWIEVLDAPFVDFTPKADRRDDYNPITVYPNAPSKNHFNFALKRKLTTGELTVLASGTKLLCFRVNVTYKDSFGFPRFADFGHFAHGKGLGCLPKYNDSN